MKQIRIGLGVLLLLVACLVFWGFFVEPNRLVVRRQTIEVAQWPRSLDGLRVAVIADIHAGGWFIDEAKLRKIVEQTNQLQPEMIVILGDYVAGDGRRHELRMAPEVFGPILKGLHAPLGVYSVLGNHDWWFDGLECDACWNRTASRCWITRSCELMHAAGRYGSLASRIFGRVRNSSKKRLPKSRRARR